MNPPDLVELFLTESEDLLRQVEQSLMALEERPEDEEEINLLFRAIHTVKGGAGIAGLETVVELTHVMENVLDRLRDGELEATEALVSVQLRAFDVLRGMVDAVSQGAPVDPSGERFAIIDQLSSCGAQQGPAASAQPGAEPPASAVSDASDAKRYRVTLRFDEDILLTGQDPLMLLDDLEDVGRLVEVHADVSAVPSFASYDPHKMYLSWRVLFESAAPRSEIDNVFLFVADDNDITIEELGAAPAASAPAPAPAASAPAAGASGQAAKVAKAVAAARAPGRQASVRVPADKLDRLVDLVGELVISMSRVESAVLKQEDREERQAALESLAQIGEELQESVMAVRMVPIEELFLRYKRVVRDLAGALGKQARLVIEGAHTELDKTVIERLADPLKHLVRNALDHGLETPEVRAAAGKEAKGTVWLRAKQQGGNIVIELADDGAGIDPERVLAKARERGLVGPDETPSPSEINAFLLAPGFSTAAKVTDVSGRGVGLDVVHRNINELRGSIAIQSEPGQGTVFRITLPLTLAIIEGLVVRVGDELLTIPMLSVLEQLRPSREQLMTVQGRGEVVVVRGEFLPLLRLHELLGFGCHEPDPTKALVVIVEHEEQRLCLLVDEVLEQEQAVVKPLERNFRSVEGIAGATIRGDGGVSLILDIRGVARMGRQAGLVARCADAANDSLAAKLRGPIAAVA